MKRSAIALSAFLLMAQAGAAAEILFGGVGNGGGTVLINGSLVVLDPTNSAATLIGTPSNLGITGLVFDNLGNLWASANAPSAPSPILQKVNPLTGGQLSSVNLTNSVGGGALAIGDLAFDPLQNTLFGISTSGVLYTIDPVTGIGTPVGDTGTGRNGGIGFTTTGTLYMSGVQAGGNALYTLNPATGAILTTVTIAQFYDGLAVRPSDGVIFANLAQFDGLATIDPITGGITSLGTMGDNKLSDIAFQVVPEPGAWALMGGGLLALMAFRRRLLPR